MVHPRRERPRCAERRRREIGGRLINVSVLDTSVPVVVIYRGGYGALAIARSLGRLGIPVYLISQTGSSPVSASRFWKKKFWWDFSAPHEQTLQFLLDVGAEVGGRPVLLTLADWAAIFIEEHADALTDRFIFPRASTPVIRKLANKWQMFQLAKQHGIPTPETSYPQSRAEVEAFARTARFPVMVKAADLFLPAVSKEIVHNERDLLDKYDRAADPGPANLILQEYIPGTAQDVWMCNAFFGADSACRAIFTGKKLRQVSDTGIASLAVCLPNAAVEHATRTFMQAVGYQGAVGIGYRYDARDGEYKLLDVNARVSGVFRLFRATNGMDVVRIAYLELTGQAIPSTALTVGRKWMLEEDFVAALQATLGGQLSLRGWAQSWSGVQESQWFAADDPVPFAIWLRPMALWLVKSAWTRLTSRLRPQRAAARL